MREVQVAGIGDPDGALDDPAVPVIQLGMIRLAGALFLDRVVDGLLEPGLVPLTVSR